MFSQAIIIWGRPPWHDRTRLHKNTGLTLYLSIYIKSLVSVFIYSRKKWHVAGKIKEKLFLICPTPYPRDRIASNNPPLPGPKSWTCPEGCPGGNGNRSNWTMPNRPGRIDVFGAPFYVIHLDDQMLTILTPATCVKGKRSIKLRFGQTDKRKKNLARKFATSLFKVAFS